MLCVSSTSRVVGAGMVNLYQSMSSQTYIADSVPA